MNENTVAQPKKSGGFLKVVLIIITLLSVVAAAAMGLLYYNAITNLELVREKNVALGEDRDKYKEQAAEYEVQIAGYEQEIADLTKQLAESQAILETPTLAGQETDVDGSTNTSVTEDKKEETAANAGKVSVSDLANVKTLDVKPDKLFDEGVNYVVTVKGANMRSGPSTNHRTVLSVYKDDVVVAYAEDGDWLMVKNEYGGYGWIKNTLVAKQ